MADITYGSEAVFSAASTFLTATAKLDATHVVTVYRDDGNSSYGTAVVGTVNPTTSAISWGTPVVFNEASSGAVSVSALDSTHFVVAYKDTGGDTYGHCKVGLTDGGNTISSYGAENTFTATAVGYFSVATLDSTHFVVGYESSGTGYGIVGVTSGTTISSYGSENGFDTGTIDKVEVAALDSTHFVIAYRDGATGGAIVGVTSGTTISSYGSENVFNNANTFTTAITALDSTHFAVAYEDNGGDTYTHVRIGLVSGTTISSYGTESTVVSENTGGLGISTLDSANFIVVYKGVTDGYGSSKIGTVSGTTVSGYNTEAVFNAGVTNNITVAGISTTHFVASYVDNSNSNYGTGIVGSIPAAIVGPANLKTLNTNAKANIATINTNPIANCKTYNTIS